MAVDGQESFAACNAERFAVSKVSQADAPQRCLSAYRASNTLADGRLSQKQQSQSGAERMVASLGCSFQQQHD